MASSLKKKGNYREVTVKNSIHWDSRCLKRCSSSSHVLQTSNMYLIDFYFIMSVSHWQQFPMDMFVLHSSTASVLHGNVYQQKYSHKARLNGVEVWKWRFSELFSANNSRKFEKNKDFSHLKNEFLDTKEWCFFLVCGIHEPIFGAACRED